jgi:hypothetical protein
MKFSKLGYMEKNMFAGGRIEQFMLEEELPQESRANIISLLEDLGVEIDACSNCGAMPMDTNCNNANCA